MSDQCDGLRLEKTTAQRGSFEPSSSILISINVKNDVVPR